MMESESSHSPNGDDSTRQLLEDRRRNDLKLKGRLEHIFDKYTRDFSRIGDEIDLETGEIIVNNGHLAQMQNERDVGSTTSLRFAKAVVAELDADDNGPVALVGEDSDQDELSIDRVLGITPVRQKVRTSIEEEPESEGHAVSIHHYSAVSDHLKTKTTCRGTMKTLAMRPKNIGQIVTKRRVT